ncbi:MAG TPA: tetratricopeptide repeat protein [Streptosporangiaceae bacterium]|nr:tetratricopeptide repeat protein [Streptosporangiaceae bacterium]
MSASGTLVLVPGNDAASAALGEMGGTGKTHAAAALAHAHHSHTADLTVWIAATGRDAVLNGYEQAVRDMGEPDHGEGPEKTASRFLAWLARTDRPWLVVLDDLADPGVMDGLWPYGPAGRVVVTTRNPGSAAQAPFARLAGVGAFSPREALAYLAARLREDPSQRTGALDLASSLGFLPVAIGHAGAFMAATGLDCREYGTRFAERRSAVAAPAGAFASIETATWSLSAELADQLPPRGLAGRALALACLLSPAGIPAAVFASQAACTYITEEPDASTDAEAAVRAALFNLDRVGLLAIDRSSYARTVVIHEVVQALAYENLAAAERERAARAAADALVQAWTALSALPPAAQALRDCTTKLHERAGAILWRPQFHPVLMQAGLSLGRSGLASLAVSYWQELFGISHGVLGPDHAQTIRALDLLSAACEASGDLTEAIAVYEARLAEREQSLGADAPAAVAAREVLARTYVAAGRPDDAVRLARRARVDSEQAHGPQHPDSLAAEETLARSYRDAGQLSEAADTFQHVVANNEQTLGNQHLETIAARGSLAEVYREAGRSKEAIALSKRTLADRERVQGPDHLDTIAARASLAAAYRQADKHKDALRLYERVRADRERVQGPDHQDTIAARGDLALSYLATKKLGNAVREYEYALADCERVLGHDHPLTRTTRENLDASARYAWAELGIDLRSPRKPESHQDLVRS